MLLYNGMRENSWLNTRTQQYYGSNTVLGSPRGWVQRAVGQKTDLFLHPTSTDPKSFSVAGIWLRNQALPDTGSWPAIYRYFRITDDIRRLRQATEDQWYPVVGAGIAVPHDRVFEIYNQIRQTALWVWFDWPQQKTVPKRAKGQPRQLLDHAELYQRFEQGQRPQEIALLMATSLNSIVYVYNKWQDGLAPSRKPRNKADHSEILADLRRGLSVPELVEKYHVSRTMIYKIRSQRHE